MIVTANNTANSISGVTIGAGTMDMLTYVEALLLQDSDGQLKDMGKKIQANLDLRKSYRQSISKLDVALSAFKGLEKGEHDGFKVKGKDDSKKMVGTDLNDMLKELGLDGLPNGQVSDYFYDTEAHDGLGGVSSEASEMTIGTKSTNKHGNTEYTIKADQLEGANKYLQGKLDDLNTEGEQFGIQLQDLSGKRKTTLETLSALISKVQDASASIIRNIAK
ncbi:MAG: hypothetical protein HY541_05910 [Deltaproteobacteria bacterium]|nr:hypothetical protein [Deltaproteobacteria bacterium]MBI4411999.1 hypothetical protein [Deltaproteobacteria bacterium]